MLVALSDTHADHDPSLSTHLAAAVREAEVVCHAGDLTTAAVLDAFGERADRFHAVHGNRDEAAVRRRLPATRTVDVAGGRVLLTHGHEHDHTGLSLLARETEADVAVVGHTHRPTVDTVGDLLVVNPGSHADPRGNRPAYARIRLADGPTVDLRTPTGDRLEGRSR